MARRRGIPFLSGEVTPDDDIQEMCHKLYGAEVDAISQTLTLIRPEEIIRAADLLTPGGQGAVHGPGRFDDHGRGGGPHLLPRPA